MRACTLNDVARMSGGQVSQGNAALGVERLHTDTRTLRAGDCFVALRGDRFDGHDYVRQAGEQGAVAAMVSLPRREDWPEHLGLVEVKDTLRGLQDFAEAYRQLLSVQTIGVTGSSGKTSTKEFIAAVLRRRYRTKATEGNLNNHIGVPITLLGLEESDEYGVIEMGMNHPGEIAPLARMAAPTIGVISNIGLAHLEHFSDQAGIAQEKTELIAHLPKSGVAVLNGEDLYSRRFAHRTSARIVWVGEGTDWFADQITIQHSGLSFRLHHGTDSILVTLPIFNRIMIQNALLAAAVGHECGLNLEEIALGLAQVKLPGGRMNLEQIAGTWIINDAYNANPDSMRAALLALKEFPEGQRRGAVLGTMGELGPQAPEFHQAIGRFAAEQKLDYLIMVGPQADQLLRGALAAGFAREKVRVAENAESAAKLLLPQVGPGDVILLKGSHFMALEKIVEIWRQEVRP